jgi:hypothetical protein
MTVDETPIKAGRSAPGKMRTAYFWPAYGEHHEICFPYASNRHLDNVKAILGANFTGVLQNVAHTRSASNVRRNSKRPCRRASTRTRLSGRFKMRGV